MIQNSNYTHQTIWYCSTDIECCIFCPNFLFALSFSSLSFSFCVSSLLIKANERILIGYVIIFFGFRFSTWIFYTVSISLMKFPVCSLVSFICRFFNIFIIFIYFRSPLTISTFELYLGLVLLTVFFFFFLSGGSNFSVSLHVSVFYWMLYNLCEINIEAEVNNICAKRRIYLFCHAARVCTGVNIFSVDLGLDHIVDLVRFSTAQSSNDLRAGSIHSFSLGFGNGCLKDFYQVSCIAFIF